MEQQVEYKTGYSDKVLDNNTAEAKIDIGNYAATFAKPEDCIVTSINMSGSPEGLFSKAGVKICGDIDLGSITTKDDLEDALSSAASWIEKKENSSKSYSYHFLAEDGHGSIILYVSCDDSGKVTKYDLTVKISDQYSYDTDAKGE